MIDERESAVAGVSRVRFKLRARVRYRGMAWTKKEVPVKVDCSEIKIRFSAIYADIGFRYRYWLRRPRSMGQT
ncbi:hypothetical protein L484_002366 [Morus notabilis]|uniref:Uncharacterized protein n=1 Tax=Morus notabilis TaxID=981085 RepID=W9S602_9ROSA|nr:hypothetical protein L484_002366 [Morus notabilis]